MKSRGDVTNFRWFLILSFSLLVLSPVGSEVTGNLIFVVTGAMVRHNIPYDSHPVPPYSSLCPETTR
jgi:hypothetical protein